MLRPGKLPSDIVPNTQNLVLLSDICFVPVLGIFAPAESLSQNGPLLYSTQGSSSYIPRERSAGSPSETIPLYLSFPTTESPEEELDTDDFRKHNPALPSWLLLPAS